MGCIPCDIRDSWKLRGEKISLKDSVYLEAPLLKNLIQKIPWLCRRAPYRQF